MRARVICVYLRRSGASVVQDWKRESAPAPTLCPPTPNPPSEHAENLTPVPFSVLWCSCFYVLFLLRGQIPPGRSSLTARKLQNEKIYIYIPVGFGPLSHVLPAGVTVNHSARRTSRISCGNFWFVCLNPSLIHGIRFITSAKVASAAFILNLEIITIKWCWLHWFTPQVGFAASEPPLIWTTWNFPLARIRLATWIRERPGAEQSKCREFCNKQEQHAAAGLEQRPQRDSCSSMVLTDGESERNHN